MPRPSLITRAVALGVLCLTVLASTACSDQTLSARTTDTATSTVDWYAVGLALGTPLRHRDGTYAADLPRTGLRVTAEGVDVSAGMGIGCAVRFLPLGNDRALLTGEVTVTSSEQSRTLADLQRAGMQITAIGQHFPDQTPDLWWIDFTGYGNANHEAAGVRTTLADTDTPAQPDSPSDTPPTPALNAAALDSIFGLHHKVVDGVYRYRLPTIMPIFDTYARRQLPPVMEASTMLMFQPLAPHRVAATGEFALTANDINPVIATLRANGIQVVSLHNHMLAEVPRLFYLDYWVTGDELTIGRALRATLDRIHAL